MIDVLQMFEGYKYLSVGGLKDVNAIFIVEVHLTRRVYLVATRKHGENETGEENAPHKPKA